MIRPPVDPAKLLEAWMEWEKGEALPGRTMSTLKTGGMRSILEDLAAASVGSGAEDAGGEIEAESWTPVV